MSQKLKVIIGNSNKRFSGVTSTMLQTMEHQQHLCDLKVLGPHNLSEPSLAVTFKEAVSFCKNSNQPVVFHARRNDEMIQALALKHLMGATNLKILFTSTAQRKHSKLSKWLMNRMDAVISTCTAAASYLENPPATIIPHGIDTSIYTPAEDKAAAWKATGFPGQYGIGIFGRVRKQKGVELFVDACLENLPELPGAVAVIVGAIDDHELVKRCKNKAAKNNLEERIFFTGELPFKEIPKLFRTMSLVCALSYNEGYGLTVLEALASGTTVLATRAGAWPDILKGGLVGKLVDTGDQRMISGEMRKLLLDHSALEQMGKQGRQLALDKYKIEDEAQSLVNFYQSLI